ncbi:MAG: hypothetical protein ACRDP6_32070 [Actinoallomurus sp.]
MSRPARITLMTVTALCAVGAPALILVVILTDLSTADQVASVAGAVAGLVGLALSLRMLRRPDPEGVRAVGDRAISVGGNVSQTSVGPNSKVRGPIAAPPTAPPAVGQVVAEGSRSIAVGGDVTGSALGEGSEVDGT